MRGMCLREKKERTGRERREGYRKKEAEGDRGEECSPETY